MTFIRLCDNEHCAVVLLVTFFSGWRKLFALTVSLFGRTAIAEVWCLFLAMLNWERHIPVSKAFLEGLTSQSSVSEFVSKLEYLEFQRDRLLLGHQASVAMFRYYFNQRTVFHYPRIYVKLWIRLKNQQKLLVVERL